jgi:hypothetical protein
MPVTARRMVEGRGLRVEVGDDLGLRADDLTADGDGRERAGALFREVERFMGRRASVLERAGPGL